jgi:hypothetical protein
VARVPYCSLLSSVFLSCYLQESAKRKPPNQGHVWILTIGKQALPCIKQASLDEGGRSSGDRAETVIRKLI